VNTFLPFPSFHESAECLDNKRLRNQLNEGKVIVRTLTQRAKAWANHPSTLMWAGYEDALMTYMAHVANEMWRRGMSVPSWAPCFDVGADVYASQVFLAPPWFGHPAVHESHRRNLLRKDYAWYKPRFPQEVGGSDVYAWPTKQADGTWIIRFKKVGAKDYETRTEPVLLETVHG
jgi:hypothetical protein